MQDFLTGTTLIFTSGTGIAIFIGGLLGGLVFGAIPGLNVLTLAAVLLPFTAWMPAEYAIMLYGVISESRACSSGSTVFESFVLTMRSAT